MLDLGFSGQEKTLSRRLTSCPTRASGSTPDDPGEVQLPPPTFRPPARHDLRDYNSRRALRSRCCSFTDPALQALLGVEVLNASPGCREDGNFLEVWGGGGFEMPGSQGAAGDRNEVWDRDRQQNPKSLGAVEWVNDSYAQGIGGQGWGAPRCFGPSLSRATCPSPGAARECCSTPTPGSEIGVPLHLPPPSRAGAVPEDRAGAGAVAGGGEKRTHRSRRRRRSSPARPPRCPLGSSPHPWYRSAAPPPAPPPSSPPNLRLESRNRAATERKKGDFPGPRRQRSRALP